MKCTACEKDLKKTELLYTEDKLPYCINPFTCNEEHPNSVKNIVARGGAVQMFTEEELDKNIFETMNVSDEMKERVIKLVAKPQSIRLSKYDNALYLLQLIESRDVESIGEAVRHCIQVAMQYEPIDGADLGLEIPSDVPAVETDTNFSDDTAEPAVVEKRKGVKVVAAAPKPSINVDWDEIDKQRKEEAEKEPEQAPAEEEEEEFSF